MFIFVGFPSSRNYFACLLDSRQSQLLTMLLLIIHTVLRSLLDGTTLGLRSRTQASGGWRAESILPQPQIKKIVFEIDREVSIPEGAQTHLYVV